MKKLITRLLIFLPIALVVYMALICLMGDWGWVRTGITSMGEEGHLNSRVKDVRNYHDVDVLFLGSSHCYRTFDTRFFSSHGYSCFNLGSSNQTPIQTHVLLQQYLDSLNPKLVVFEVHPDIMHNDGVESAVNLLANTPLTLPAITMALSTRNMKVINTLIWSAYNQKICHRLETFSEDTLIRHFRYIPGGYCEVDSSAFQKKNYPRKAIEINPKQMASLKACIEMFKERDIPYLLVEIQDAEQQRRSYTNHDKFEQQMAELGRYHYTILPLIDTVHFFNSNHLNTAGAEIYNQHLLTILNSL